MMKMKTMNGKILLFLLTALLLAPGCVRQIKKEVVVPGEKAAKEYQKLTDYQLKLTMVSPRTLLAGSDAKAVFALENIGTKDLVIKEWYKDENENLATNCQLWLPGTENPDETAWVELERVPPKTTLRYPLRLSPGNRVFLTQPLPFIRHLVLQPGHERRYFLKAKLNLTSVDVVSPVAAIAVRPPTLRSKTK